MTTIATDDLVTLIYYRGDSSAIGFTVLDSSGAVVDITGNSYRMTVSRIRHPSSTEAAGNQVATFTGTIVDGPNGRVAFNPPAAAFDALDVGAFDRGVADLWYDVEETTGAAVHTFGTGRFQLKQDVSK